MKTFPALADTDRLTLPLDSYLLSDADYRQLGRAHRTLVQQCMRRFGFSFDATEPAAAPEAPPNSRRYGVSNARAVAVYGYGAGATAGAERGGESSEQAPDPAELSVLTGRGQRTLNGMPVPKGGCAGEAQRKLAGAEQSQADLSQRLAAEALDRSRQDSRVRAVIAQWSSCMKAAGFDYAGPLDPPGDPTFEQGLTADEIQTAKTDLACKKKVNLLGIWSAVEAAYQQRQIEGNRESLDALKQQNAETLRRAAATVK